MQTRSWHNRPRFIDFRWRPDGRCKNGGSPRRARFRDSRRRSSLAASTDDLKRRPIVNQASVERPGDRGANVCASRRDFA